MLLLTDNDIIIKLAALDLLIDFFNSIEITEEQIYISPTARYSLPAQLRKRILDTDLLKKTLNVIERFNVIDSFNDELANELQSIPNVDSGEAALSSVLIEHSASFKLATSDKRFLTSMASSQYAACFENRIFTFESCLLILCNKYDYQYVKEKILACSKSQGEIIDNLFRLAFRENCLKDDDLHCLQSHINQFKSFCFQLIHP